MTTLLGSSATTLLMIAGLLYMIGARRLAGRTIVLALALVFLGCLWASLSFHVPAIDPVPVAAIGSLLLLGLVGAGIAYARMRRARRNRKTSEAVRPFAPEPVPTVRDASRGHGEGRP